MNELLKLLPSLKGAALSSLFLFFMEPGRAWQQKEIALYTGYSPKSVAMGLEQLNLHALAIFHGKYNGWALADGVKQLPLIHKALEPVDNCRKTVDNSVDNSPPQLSDGNEQHGKFTGYSGTNTENLPIAPPSTYTRTHTRVSSSSFKSSNPYPVRGEEERTPHQPVNFTDCSPSPTWGVADWLIYGGIGRASPVLSELLGMGLSVAYVKAHVEALREKGEPAAYLVHRLRCGDAPPPRKKTGQRPTIPKHLEGIIKT